MHIGKMTKQKKHGTSVSSAIFPVSFFENVVCKDKQKP